MTKTGTQKIETPRLILRRFRMEDAEDMFRNWAFDPEVTKYLTWPPHANISVTRKVLESWISSYEDGGCFNWAIEWKETGRAIGSITVVHLTEEIGAAEIGYCLGRAYWGRGIMPEALTAVENYLFDEAGLNRITAGHDVNNPKSGRVMEKAGMKREGILRQAGKNSQGLCDMAVYAILKNDRHSPGTADIVPPMKS